MPKKLSPFEIERVFELMWDNYPNKTGEASAKKALLVANNSELPIRDIQKAVELYLLDSIGTDPEYLYRLGNFIREDHWKDVLENVSEAKLMKAKRDAQELISKWNQTCHKHWCPVTEPDARLATAIKALHDKSFHTNWRSALILAGRIFQFPLRDEDIRSKIKLSFRWFTTIQHDKHTVLRLIEGEYGKPASDEVRKVIVSVPIDQAARSELAVEIGLFIDQKGMRNPDLKTVRPTVDLPPVVITDAAVRLVEEMKRQLGKKNYVRRTTEVEDLVAKLGIEPEIRREEDAEDELLQSDDGGFELS